MNPSDARVHAAPLRRWTEQILLAKGTPPRDAERVTEVMIKADLRGVDTHGVFVCVQPYLDRIDQVRPNLQKINLEPKLKILQDRGAALLLDGDWGFGQVAAWEAMELAIERARAHGIGMVSVTRSTHLGMCAYYPLMAVAQDMIGITMTNTTPAAVPTFGRKARLGTNPMSLAAPAGKHPPFELDMATTVVSGGKVYLSHLAQKKMPEGWMVDEQGNPLTDATVGLQSGSHLPLGGAGLLHGGHKGYGLGLIVEILCGVLAGGNIGPRILAGENYHWVTAIDVSVFQPAARFKAMMDDLIDTLHRTPTVAGHDRVLVPGELEHRTHQHRIEHGIPVSPAVLPWIEETSRKFGLDPPQFVEP